MPRRGLLGTGLVAIIATAIFAACGSSAPSGAATVAGSARAGQIGLKRIGVFSQPVYLAAAPGDSRRLFVVQKGGQIVVLVGGRRQAHPFLDLSSQVNSSGEEQGLLSMAFAPNYKTSGLFYVYYTDASNNLRIVQYRRAGGNLNRAGAASGRPVLTIDHHTESNHNGGQLQFGPDGDLYIGVGDGGSEGDPHSYGQNTDVLLGKVLRISPRPGGGYAIPAGNPFAGASGRRPEIWAYGLRNPWRFSFDRSTGDLVIGDVGQDTEEEIDFARHGQGAGANYGWSIFEGDHRYKQGSAPGAIKPALVALHSNGYCAIIGGYVVRDHSLGSLYGRYLYGDNCHAGINSALLSAGHARQNHPSGLSVNSLSAFGQDGAGHIYAVSLAGPVYRLVRR
ncbi:MAG TPA: PQQ-dependent sugar dehydrogenase [Solirubrobacteraceae bacterium]|nr:PQQ-dependent sugar dehydrogenase [Solirubrobacteraceae bacterium]